MCSILWKRHFFFKKENNTTPQQQKKSESCIRNTEDAHNQKQPKQTSRTFHQWSQKAKSDGLATSLMRKIK